MFMFLKGGFRHMVPVCLKSDISLSIRLRSDNCLDKNMDKQICKWFAFKLLGIRWQLYLVQIILDNFSSKAIEGSRHGENTVRFSKHILFVA